MKNRLTIVTGAVIMASAVALGAFGAHSLKELLDPKDMAIYQTAVLYQLIHGLAVLAVSSFKLPETPRRCITLGFTAGIVIFSGSLYSLVLSQQRWLGAITPIGGTLLISSWLGLAWTAFRERSQPIN